MKKLLTLFTFLFLASMTFAQITVNVSGTVTDTDGNGVGDITVHIVVDSTGTDFNYYNEVLTNPDGTYADSFEVPEELSQGLVYAWIQNCNQTNLYQSGYWSPGGGPVLDFVYCNVNCGVSIAEIGNGSLQATASGEAPFAYAWNNGGTQAVITAFQSGSYCVTITDNNACQSATCYYYQVENPDTLCYVSIGIDSSEMGADFELTALPGGNAPFSYLWSTGETTQSIDVSALGEYCVSIIDATGCTSSSCYDFGDGCNFSVNILEGNASLFAETTGSQVATYQWSTGETTQYMVPPVPNQEYCVTATDIQGCEAMSCHYYYMDTTFIDSCYVYIEVVQNGAWLQANASGVAPFTYLWSTGEATPAIEITEEIEYCVSIIDATGCTIATCYDNTPTPFLIHGYVYPYDSLEVEYIDGIAELYSIDGDIITYVTSTSIDSNYYYFGEVTSGDYLTKAIVEGYLPTYHYNAEFWDEADIVSADAPLWWGYDISLLPLDDEFTNDGPALISGTVNGNNSAEIILFDENGNALAYVFTDEDGSYSFENLPYGTYTVYIEIPGYEQVFYTITLSPNNEIVDNADFEVNDETIMTGSREVLLAKNTLIVYPNPTKDELFVNLEVNIKGNAVIQIVNSIGQAVLNDTFEQNKRLNVSMLSTGVYLIKVTTPEGIAVQQFVKE